MTQFLGRYESGHRRVPDPFPDGSGQGRGRVHIPPRHDSSWTMESHVPCRKSFLSFQNSIFLIRESFLLSYFLLFQERAGAAPKLPGVRFDRGDTRRKEMVCIDLSEVSPGQARGVICK